MKKQWFYLLKLQEVGDKNIFCFYDNRAKPLNVSLSHFPHLPGHIETRKKGEGKTVIEVSEELLLKSIKIKALLNTY